MDDVEKKKEVENEKWRRTWKKDREKKLCMSLGYQLNWNLCLC